jgi:hypothetical protein
MAMNGGQTVGDPTSAGQSVTSRSARGDGPALAGFVCGLASVGAALLAGLLAVAAIPGGSSGEALLLLLGMVPVAVAGLALSIRGRHAPTRRGLARAGIALSATPLGLFALVAVLVILSWVRCAPSCV